MKVLILMGSTSDIEAMKECANILDEFGVENEMTIASAHRTPERVLALIAKAEKKGAKAIVAGAGMAAHLAGAVAANTLIPVIGVPLNASSLDGMDSLLSTVQMPPGIPVATVAVGKAGAKNAAHLAMQIVALEDKALLKKLKKLRRKMTTDTEKAAAELDKSRLGD